MCLAFPYAIVNGGLALDPDTDVSAVYQIASTTQGEYAPLPDLGIPVAILETQPSIPAYLREVEAALIDYQAVSEVYGTQTEDGVLIEIAVKEKTLTWLI
jgi:hypothetical protein